jgi:HEAT repeat protein
MSDQPPGRRDSLRERDGAPVATIQKCLKDLESSDFRVRTDSLTELEKLGQPAAEAIVESLMKQSPRLELLSSYSDALEEIGRPSVSVIANALSHIREVRRPEHAHLVETFVESLARIGGRREAPTIVEQLPKLDAAIRRNGNVVLVDCCEKAKVEIHRVLAELNVKDAVDDLVAMLGDGRRRVRLGIVEAVEELGDRRALVPLLRLHRLEEDVSFSGANQIERAFVKIARREKAAAGDADFKDLGAEERTTLEKFLPRAKH